MDRNSLNYVWKFSLLMIPVFKWAPSGVKYSFILAVIDHCTYRNFP